MSEDTANLIDSETKLLLEQGQKLARKILEEHIDQLHALAGALLEYETLSGEEINDVLAGKKIRSDMAGNTGKSEKIISSVPKSGAKKPEKKKSTKKKPSPDTPGDAPQNA